MHDVLGLYDRKIPKFARQFAQLEGPMVEAVQSYRHSVKTRDFPAMKEVGSAEFRRYAAYRILYVCYLPKTLHMEMHVHLARG